MSAWIAVPVTIGRDARTKRAARALGIGRPALIGHVTLLWAWALDLCEAGDVTDVDPADLAEEVLWTGDPAAFVAALEAAGFLAREGDRLVLADWDAQVGRLLDQRAANRQRQAAARARRREKAEARNRDVTVTSPTRHGATEQNTTEENPTRDDPTEPKPTEAQGRTGSAGARAAEPRDPFSDDADSATGERHGDDDAPARRRRAAHHARETPVPPEVVAYARDAGLDADTATREAAAFWSDWCTSGQTGDPRFPARAAFREAAQREAAEAAT